MTNNLEAVERLEALARAATPGPWAEKRGFPGVIIPASHADRPMGGSIFPEKNRNFYAQQICCVDRELFGRGSLVANAAFIATANPETILALISTLRSQAEALEKAREAMTASGATKAAYHGEFKFQLTQWREDDDGEPEEYLADITVPWTTVKEIMAAIAARAALTPEVSK